MATEYKLLRIKTDRPEEVGKKIGENDMEGWEVVGYSTQPAGSMTFGQSYEHFILFKQSR